MSEIKRRNPRRPYTVAPDGARRIVLGATEQGAVATSGPIVPQARSKPLRSRERPETWYVAIAHAERGDLDEPARQAIAAAAILATPATGVLAVILGSFAGDAGALGADAALVVSDCGEQYDPEREVAICRAAIARYAAAHVFLADKPDGDGDVGRRLAAAMGIEAGAHVAELDRSHVAVTWSGGREVARRALPRLVLLAKGAVDPTLPFAGRGERIGLAEIGAVAAVEAGIRDLGTTSLGARDVPLEEADLIVAAGNGVRSMGTLNRLAGALDAAVGASRVAVDEGKCLRHQQVGATGKTVSATTYIAVGISGAVQHLQGIKDCRHVIAINTDAGAPIAGRADLTIVDDSEAVMQALLAVIQSRRRRNEPEAA